MAGGFLARWNCANSLALVSLVFPLPSWLILVVGTFIVWRNRKGDVLKPRVIVPLYFVYQGWISPLINKGAETLYPYGVSTFEEYFPKLAWLILFSILAFEFGSRLHPMELVRHSLSWLDDFSIDRRWAYAFIGISILFGIVVLNIRLDMHGSTVFQTLKYRADVPEHETVENDFIFHVLSYLAPVGITIYYCLFAARTHDLRPKLLTLGLGLFYWFMQAPTGRRTNSAEVLIMLLFAASFLEIRFKFGWGKLVLMLMLGLGYAVAGHIWRTWSTASTFFDSHYREFFIMQASRIYAQTVLLRYIPDVLPYYGGREWIYALLPPLGVRLFPILGWHRRRPAKDVVAAHFDYPPKTAPLIGLLGELYANFSIVGVIVGFFIYGWLLESLYRVLVADQGNPASVAVFAVMSPFLLVRLLDGQSEALFYILLNLLLALILLKVTQSRSVSSTCTDAGTL